jgi:hypothetical protein
MIIAGHILSYLGSQMNFASSVLSFIEEENTKCSKNSSIKNAPFVTGM